MEGEEGRGEEEKLLPFAVPSRRHHLREGRLRQEEGARDAQAKQLAC